MPVPKVDKSVSPRRSSTPHGVLFGAAEMRRANAPKEYSTGSCARPTLGSTWRPLWHSAVHVAGPHLPGAGNGGCSGFLSGAQPAACESHNLLALTDVSSLRRFERRPGYDAGALGSLQPMGSLQSMGSLQPLGAPQPMSWPQPAPDASSGISVPSGSSWRTADGTWCMEHSARHTTHSARRLANDARRTAHGARRPAHGAPRPANGERSMAYDARHTAHGARHTAHGAWRMARGAQRTAYVVRRTAHGAQRPA